MAKIDKVDETVAMPTVRNYSPETQENKTLQKSFDGDEIALFVNQKSSRNTNLPHPDRSKSNAGTL